MPNPTEAPTAPRRSPRLSVRGLMLLVAGLGLAMALLQFWAANRNSDRATLSHQMGVLADRESGARARLGAIDGMSSARGRQARRALRLLASTLEDPDPIIRASAARMIGRLGSQVISDAGPTGSETVRPAALALLDRVGDPDGGASAEAIHALMLLNRSGPEGGPVAPEEVAGDLRELLEHDRSLDPSRAEARLAAMAALCVLEPIRGEGPPWLLRALDDPDPAVRRAAIEAALQPRPSGPPSDDPLPDAPSWLLRALDDQEAEVRMAAVWRCSTWVGTPAYRLEPAWGNPDEVADALLRGMGACRGEELAYRVVHLAANRPGGADAFASEIIRGFEARLEGDPRDWQADLSALEALGPAARPALPMLVRASRIARDADEPWLRDWLRMRLAEVASAIDFNSEETAVLYSEEAAVLLGN
ncbi:HEAT repeat domain-containing protein [Tautonia plasticadhaerens]|uniref:HEAT repeat protein n=1 Tax=Tautonia plasticadhaerens TaxID=2527974 RepID=A0A518HDC1_9BACT|nr:HEAT repeat domain-containing protein [Tautonia plasticadhaerens]QDV38857.1 HEAT repeat protein [Tautonia plasticadhaerens]